jgi:hypothetical protein
MKRSLLLLLAVVCLRTAQANYYLSASDNTDSPQLSPSTPSNISAIWANEGGDKVSQDELRASNKTENLTGTVINRAWDGGTIHVAGARNESVSFNLVLEAATAAASSVAVSFNTLTGSNGATIQTTTPASGDGVFNWVNRPIELFYMRYLQIKGLSVFGYYKGDEQEFPTRFAAASHQWTDRPDHDKFYPDILVPLELVPQFQIAQGQNQSIWTDIYIPKGTPPGTYTGTVQIAENGVTTWTVPVQLTVNNFSLPDVPTLKQFTNVDPSEIMWRYVTGYGGYVNWQTAQGLQVKGIADKYYQFLHRHKIDAIGGETECPSTARQPCYMNLPRYTGDLYTAANGYDGPGVGQGTSLYAIGPYGTWGDPYSATAASMRKLADDWESWFENNLPNTEHFIYLSDEPDPDQLPQVENWAKWINQDPNIGHNLLTLSTVSIYNALPSIPDLKIAMTLAWIGDCGLAGPPCNNTVATESQINQYMSKPSRRLWLYNMNRPGVGTDDTEDDGIAMRTVAWAQYKMGIERWFYWYANLNDFSKDWFQTACTWDCDNAQFNQWLGQTNDVDYSNGVGILVYPGTDVTNPADSYGVNGPFASLRLKEMRRGLQDGDYLTLAAQIDPASVQSIVARTMPKALWENPAPYGDPSWFLGPVSWSANPDDWESSRAQLTAIISNYCSANPNAQFCQ